MTIPFWCLLIVLIIPYVLAGVAGYFKTTQLGTLDNNNPRQQSAALTGAGARVFAAQQNAWEAMAVFTAAVLVAHFAGAEAQMSANLAMAFVAFRILHAVAYIADWATLRSLLFVGALASAIWLFILAG